MPTTIRPAAEHQVARGAVITYNLDGDPRVDWPGCELRALGELLAERVEAAGPVAAANRGW